MEGLGRHRPVPLGHKDVRGQPLFALQTPQRAYLVALHRVDTPRAVLSGDQTARIWDAATGKEIAVLRGHDSPVRSAAFSPDGARIVTASRDKTARIWDAASAKEMAVLRG